MVITWRTRDRSPLYKREPQIECKHSTLLTVVPLTFTSVVVRPSSGVQSCSVIALVVVVVLTHTHTHTHAHTHTNTTQRLIKHHSAVFFVYLGLGS